MLGPARAGPGSGRRPGPVGGQRGEDAQASAGEHSRPASAARRPGGRRPDTPGQRRRTRPASAARTPGGRRPNTLPGRARSAPAGADGRMGHDPPEPAWRPSRRPPTCPTTTEAGRGAGRRRRPRQRRRPVPGLLRGVGGPGRAGDGAGDPVAAYAYARTGYHRGLDQLRRAGWNGHGPIPWEHEPNRGFLRALHLLAVAAAAIGEDDEASRCQRVPPRSSSRRGRPRGQLTARVPGSIAGPEPLAALARAMHQPRTGLTQRRKGL